MLLSDSYSLSCEFLSICSTKEDNNIEEKEQLSFVGVTSTEWDAEVTVGDYKYKFSIDFEDNNTLTFFVRRLKVNQSHSNHFATLAFIFKIFSKRLDSCQSL